MKNKKEDKDMMIIIVVMILIPLLLTLSPPSFIQKYLNSDEISQFTHGIEFRCKTNHRGSDQYLVSVHRGWKVFDDEYFIKGDYIVQIKYCTRLD